MKMIARKLTVLLFTGIIFILLTVLTACGQDNCPHINTRIDTVEPTCTEKGYSEYKCLVCGYGFKADYVAPKGHEMTLETVAPSCESEGYTKHTCSVCGVEERSDVVSRTSHKFDLTVVEPSCEEGGYTYAKCTECGYYTSYDFTKPTGHEMTLETTAPTCETEGYTTYSCKSCSYSYVSDRTAPTSHDFEQTVVAPTCEEEGYTKHTCTVCGAEERTNFVQPGQHVLSADITPPTCEDEGYTTYSCEKCEYSFRSDFEKPTGHDYRTEKVRPNLERTGHTVYTCNSCGSTHISDFVFYSDIFKGAAGKGEGALAFGIDVSYHNGEIDWERVKAAGVDYVIIRLGSSYSKDPAFERNYEGAKAAGLDVGVYFYTYSLDAESAANDASLTLEWLDGRKLEYPVFYDIEDYSGADYYPSALPEETLMSMAQTYMSALVDGGYFPGLYTNNNFLYSKYNEEKVLGLYEVWYARYRYNDYLDFEQSYSTTYSMWQYSDRGYIDGIYGDVDINLAFKDYPSMMKEYGYNGY